jgi:hypothetical protein
MAVGVGASEAGWAATLDTEAGAMEGRVSGKGKGVTPAWSTRCEEASISDSSRREAVRADLFTILGTL